MVNGSTSLGNTNPLIVNTAGTYSVVYTSTAGCASSPSASVTTTITPEVSDPIVPKAFNPCLGVATLIGNVPVYGTGSWSVLPPTSAILTSGATPNIGEASNLIDGNIYKFIYTISGVCGNKKDSVLVTAGLIGFTVDAGGPLDTLCVLTSRELYANVTGGSGKYSYIWVSSDGSFTSADTT